MGKRQRLTQFIGLTNEALLALIQDPRTPADIRAAALTEAKYRKLRNVQKRTR